jgi:hypothetical protein
MTRAFLPTESQARYTDDQFEAIRALARITADKDCAFAVVAGDVFDSIQPDRRIVSRAVDALAAFTVPVYLLPGNHDADSPAALWSTANVIERLPTNIRVLRDTTALRVPGVGAEVIGAPWPSSNPNTECPSFQAPQPTGRSVFGFFSRHVVFTWMVTVLPGINRQDIGASDTFASQCSGPVELSEHATHEMLAR